ncbi:acetyltransferase [Bacillus megaterium]|nr:acetyltransferase [Priestia megaterium]
MKKKVVVIGAGGHARVIIDILKKQEIYELVGCINNTGIGNEIEGVTIIGNDKILPTLISKGVCHAFIAIGDNQIRKDIFKKLAKMKFQFVNVISPFSYIASSAKLGSGIAIMPGAVINAHTKIADNVIINTGATIDHDTIIGKHAHIAPGCNLAGNVLVEEGAFVGIGAKIIPKMTIGEWSLTGAGSVVVRDVESFSKVMGVPARKFN